MIWRCLTISKQELQINEEIRDKEIRVIGADGAQLGIMSARDALNLAAEKNLDLVKIAPQATPPVCKIIDYGKYRFEQAKREKEAKKNQRVVEIKEIRILEMALPRVRMEVSCSKGTYIRTLCHDIGEKLCCFGCMESLLRTKVSRFEIESSLKLSEIQKKREEGKLSEIITPLDAVFFQYPAVTVKKEGQALAYNGNEIPIRFVTDMEERKNQEWIRVYDLENHFIGIFCFDKNRKKLTVEKMFLDQEEIRG